MQIDVISVYHPPSCESSYDQLVPALLEGYKLDVLQ